MKIAVLFQIRNRFLRSAHLERDFADPSSLQGYIVTEQTKRNIERLAAGLAPNSGQRAWRITGDYGAGKSSFGLVLAHLFAGRGAHLPSGLRRAVNLKELGVPPPQLLPMLVTGSREPLAVALLRSLKSALLRVNDERKAPKLLDRITILLEGNATPVPEDTVIELLGDAKTYLRDTGKATGLFIIVDELGKFLEFAAYHPEQQDVYLLQKLAEAAARSGKTPLFVVGILHQGFSAYADLLSQSVQREWEKVAGRFEELLFNQPLEQVVILVADALNIRSARLPKTLPILIQKDMKSALTLGWYGAASTPRTLAENAARLYPLHPTVLPVLVKLFSRFGQNERSLFSFLLSNEPFGLQDFASKSIEGNLFFRLHNLYDYARTSFGHRLNVQSYRSHWNVIDSMIESFATEDELELNILKTVGLINLVNSNDLLATEEVILLSLGGSDSRARKQIKIALERLYKKKRVLHHRGAAGGFCLWPHTSVDLEKAYEDASRTVGIATRVANFINEYLEPRPIVARRHYIHTGSIRHFEVRYCSDEEVSAVLQKGFHDADGAIIVPLCETEAERRIALEFSKRQELKDHSNWLFAVPQPLSNLAGLLQEVRRWEWISTNTPELNGDKYAREEVTRQYAASRLNLEARIRNAIGLKHFTARLSLQWFRQNEQIQIDDARHLLSLLSDICDETFPQSPLIHNELVNRRTLSSAAAAARMRLIERMFSYSKQALLGMDPNKKPPEMSIYLSVLKRAGLHQEKGSDFEIAQPAQQGDNCRVLPALGQIDALLRRHADSRVNATDLFAELRKEPFGLRDGVIPILFAAYAIAHRQEIAFYENGTFLREVRGEEFLRLTKTPDRFDLQYCKIEGVRADLFDKLLAILELPPAQNKKSELLDVVRPLCVFVAQLPSYVHSTKKLSTDALAVRDSILAAREPVKLLFNELPQACRFERFAFGVDSKNKTVQAFVKSLKSALDELKFAYPNLKDRLKNKLQTCYDLPGSFEQARRALSERSGRIVMDVTEPKLKAFCLRLDDDNLPDSEWIESLGSYLALKPPAKWNDSDEDVFSQELSQLVERFQRVESVLFSKKGNRPQNSTGVRLAITQSDGSERERVIYFTPDEEDKLTQLQNEVSNLLSKDRRLGLAAASRAIWKTLSERNKDEQ
jgi:hypothetical protein